jgi:hypothetical protein
MEKNLRAWFAERLRMSRAGNDPFDRNEGHFLAWAMRCAATELPGPRLPLPR